MILERLPINHRHMKALLILIGMALVFSVLSVVFNAKEGAAQNVTEIRTAEELNNVRFDLKGHYKLMNDIDLDVAPYNTGEGWEPIGPETYDNNFQGTF